MVSRSRLGSKLIERIADWPAVYQLNDHRGSLADNHTSKREYLFTEGILQRLRKLRDIMESLGYFYPAIMFLRASVK